MDLAFPADLEWVSYLAGSRWPQGSESAWWRTAGDLRATAGELEALIHPLRRVRSRTQAVLGGHLAAAADAQFATLFEGQQSVDKLVDALRALGDAAEQLGTEIQYTKLSIITTLTIAAATIIWALVNSEWTAGGSLAQIPIVQWLTDNAISRTVSMALERITATLAEKLGSTMVARLLVTGAVSAAIGAGQEAGIEGGQVAEGHRDSIDVGKVWRSALSMGAAGVAGGLAGHAVGGLLGHDGSTVVRALKGAVTGLSSGEAANVAGAVAGKLAGGGGNLGLDTVLGGAIGLVHGGLHGAGEAHGGAVDDTTENAVANAIDTHPTLRFEQQSDGTFAWPGETVNNGGPQGNTALSPDVAIGPATAGGDHASGAPLSGVSSAGDLATGCWQGPAAGHTATEDELGAQGLRSSPVGRDYGASNPVPLVAGSGLAGLDRGTAGVEPARTALTSLGLATPPGALDRSLTSPAAYTGAVTAAIRPTFSSPSGLLNDAGPPSASPNAADPPSSLTALPEPSSSPEDSADPGTSFGPPCPTTDARAGRADSLAAAGSAATPPVAAVTRAVDATAAVEATPATQQTSAHPAAAGSPVAGPAGQTIDAATHAASGRAETSGAAAETAAQSETHGAIAGRDEGKSDGRENAHSGDPVTARTDPNRPDSTRPDSTRRDGSRPPGKPGPLRRGGAARDVSGGPLAAADALVGARRDDAAGAGEDQRAGVAANGDAQARPTHGDGNDDGDTAHRSPGTAGGDGDDAGGGSGLPIPAPPPDPQRPRSPEERDFLDWYRARDAVPEGQRQSLKQYAATTGIDAVQMRRWLSGAGVDPAVVDANEPPGRVPEPGQFVAGNHWLAAMRRYLALRPQRMEALIEAEPGTWERLESGDADAATAQVRALLRRVAEARCTYFSVGRQFPVYGLLTERGEARWPEGYEHVHHYLKAVRARASIAQPGFAEAAKQSVNSLREIERGKYMPRRDWIEEYLRLGGGATYADVTECYGLSFEGLAVEELRFPNPFAVENLTEYVAYLQRVNNVAGAETARLLGIDPHGMSGFLKHPHPETSMLRRWRRVLHRAGPYNDFAHAWGYRYRMDPAAGDVFPRPDLFDQPRDFAFSLRLYHTSEDYRCLTQQQWASRTGLTVEQIKYAEDERGYSPLHLRTIHKAGLIPHDALQEALHRFPPTTPASYPPDRFGCGRWLAALRVDAGMTQDQLTVAVGRSAVSRSIGDIEHRGPPSRAVAHSLCVAMRIPDTLREQGLAHFFPPADTSPANHTLGSWLRAQLDNADLTQPRLANAVRLSLSFVNKIANDQQVPLLSTFRRLCDALEIHGSQRVDAVRRFYSDRHPTGADPDDEQLFWGLVDTRVDSPQERELANQIYEGDRAIADRRPGYAWIAERVARRWARVPADRDHFEQVARAAILTAIVNHTPTSPFTAHAFASCRGAIRQAYFERRYPDGVGFGRWLKALRVNAGMTQGQLAEASGRSAASRGYIDDIENGAYVSPAVAHSLCVALGIPDTLREQGLAHFFPPVDTTPANHTPGSWLRAHLDNADLTQTQLARVVRLSFSSVNKIANDHRLPMLSTFRRLCDALDIHGPERFDAVGCFYSERYPIGADPDEEQLFWGLVDTEVGSPQERELRNQIYEGDRAIADRRPGYAWIANAAARRWVRTPADRDDFEQVASAAILTAIVNHVPTGPFIMHAFASCRGAIRKAYFERRYPDLDPATRRIVIAVAAHLGRVDPAAPTPDPANIAAALKLNRADVTHALQILSQPTVSSDQPVTGRSGDQFHREVADPRATTALADSNFTDRVRAALADLPDPDTATRLVLLHLVDGTPLDQEPEPEREIPPGAAQQLGLSPQTAAEIISAAIPRLQTAFQPPTPEHA